MLKDKDGFFTFDFRASDKRFDSWIKEGFTLETANQWDSEGFLLEGAKEFLAKGLTPEQAKEYVINELKGTINLKIVLKTGIYTKKQILKFINKKIFDLGFL